MPNAIADAGGIGLSLARRRDERGELTGDDLSEFIVAGDAGVLQALRELGNLAGPGLCVSERCARPAAVRVRRWSSCRRRTSARPHPEVVTRLTRPRAGTIPEPDFVVAELVNDAGVVGAADLARRRNADSRE